MSPSSYSTLTKREIVESQLKVALDFYFSDEEYLSVITLAGAAEEILGKIVSERGEDTSLQKEVHGLKLMHKILFPESNEPCEKELITLLNNPRNHLKHLVSGQELTIDCEREAAKMLNRALENYEACFTESHELHQEFNQRRMQNWRSKKTK